MSYRAAYMSSADAKAFIYQKRGALDKLIEESPSLDDLVQ